MSKNALYDKIIKKNKFQKKHEKEEVTRRLNEMKQKIDEVKQKKNAEILLQKELEEEARKVKYIKQIYNMTS